MFQYTNIRICPGKRGVRGWGGRGQNVSIPKFVTMIENENTEEEIREWTENHREAVAIYHVPFKKIE